jgi:hypothetical protein
MLDSIKSFRTWAAAPGKKYDQAVKIFERDLESAKSRDRDEVTISALPQDLDLRKGEVEVPGVCSLHSTSEGFRLVTHDQAFTGFGYAFFSSREAGRREYEVNSQTGTITVTEVVGASSWSGVWPGSSKGYTERYTLDTANGTIADYSKKPSSHGGVFAAGGLLQDGAFATDSSPGYLREYLTLQEQYRQASGS